MRRCAVRGRSRRTQRASAVSNREPQNPLTATSGDPRANGTPWGLGDLGNLGELLEAVQKGTRDRDPAARPAPRVLAVQGAPSEFCEVRGATRERPLSDGRNRARLQVC